MIRLIYTLRVISTLVQRQEVNRLVAELKNLQPNLKVYKEDFVHLVNCIIKFHENAQNLIQVSVLKMSKNQKKLKALKKALSTDYQKNILDYLLQKKKGDK